MIDPADLTLGAIIRWTDKQFGQHHEWRVIGVFLGALGQESVVELENVSHNPAGSEGAWFTHHSMWVPECLLRDCEIAPPPLSPETP